LFFNCFIALSAVGACGSTLDNVNTNANSTVGTTGNSNDELSLIFEGGFSSISQVTSTATNEFFREVKYQVMVCMSYSSQDLTLPEKT
jgi:hypothetical protein